jgi:hypothetical protein
MLRCVALTALLVAGAVVAGLAVISGATAEQSPRSAPSLLVQGHRESFETSLSDNVHVEGRLYPALPGVNSLDLTIYGLATASSSTSLQLRAVMPGMAMQPIRTSLVSANSHVRQLRGQRRPNQGS